VLVVLQFVSGGAEGFRVDTPLQKFLSVTWQAEWLLPYESGLRWMVAAATLTLLVPLFLASWVVEYRVALGRLPGVAPTSSSRLCGGRIWLGSGA
jgi:hypothetical protein